MVQPIELTRAHCIVDFVHPEDLLSRAKHLFFLPWWLAARSARQGAGSTLPRMRMTWPPSPSIDEQMFGAKQQVPHGGNARGRHCLSPPFGGARRVEAEHELAKSRPVFVPRPACRFRGVTGYHLRIHSEISQAETAGSRAETLDRDREGGRSAIAAEARRSAIAAEARCSAIALRSALREHQGPPAKGASTPHGSTFRSIRRNEAPGGSRSKWQRPF